MKRTPRGPHICVDHELFEVPALLFIGVTLAFSLKAPRGILLNKLVSNQREIRQRKGWRRARSKSLGCSFEPLSYKLGVSDRVHSKGGVWEVGIVGGRTSASSVGGRGQH